MYIVLTECGGTCYWAAVWGRVVPATHRPTMLAHKVFYLRLVESIIELGRGGSEKSNPFGSPSGDADSLGSIGSF